MDEGRKSWTDGWMEEGRMDGGGLYGMRKDRMDGRRVGWMDLERVGWMKEGHGGWMKCSEDRMDGWIAGLF